VDAQPLAHRPRRLPPAFLQWARLHWPACAIARKQGRRVSRQPRGEGIHSPARAAELKSGGTTAGPDEENWRRRSSTVGSVVEVVVEDPWRRPPIGQGGGGRRRPRGGASAAELLEGGVLGGSAAAACSLTPGDGNEQVNAPPGLREAEATGGARKSRRRTEQRDGRGVAAVSTTAR
jgi:hypothetical protein